MKRRLTAAFLCAGIFVFTAGVHAGELLQDISGAKLRVVLVVKEAQWAAGSFVELDAVVTNQSEAPLRIDAFGEMNALYEGKREGSYIASCWTLAWEPAARPAGLHPGKALLHKDQFVLLGPKETYTKHFRWIVKDIAPGKYQVRLAYAPRVASPSFNFPEHWLRQQGIAEPIWTGMVFSEPLEIEVIKSE